MQHLQPNTTLQSGKYRIEKLLGQGSFGVTYLANYTYKHKRVAIKEFFMKGLNTRNEDGSVTGIAPGTLSYNYAQKFQKEVLNLMDLNHSNIISVEDFFEEKNTYYYVMEYIEGENLNDFLKSHSLSKEEATTIIGDIARALQYMHEEKHMLHLDLKPGNVMRRKSDGHIFLIDFGLSKHFDENGVPDTSTSIGLGTPGYAPIEQGNQAKNGEFRPTIDIYALGATYFKLLTGQTPPESSVLVSEPTAIQDELTSHALPESVVNFVTHAMNPNVNLRIPSAKVFIDELPKFISSNEDDTLVNSSNDEDTALHEKESEEETKKKEAEKKEKQLREEADHIYRRAINEKNPYETLGVLFYYLFIGTLGLVVLSALLLIANAIFTHYNINTPIIFNNLIRILKSEGLNDVTIFDIGIWGMGVFLILAGVFEVLDGNYYRRKIQAYINEHPNDEVIPYLKEKIK